MVSRASKTFSPLAKTLLLGAGVVVAVSSLALIDYLIQLDRSEGSVPPGTESQIGGSFSLIDQHSTPVSNRDFADRHKLIFFGFTHCPDVCPTTLSRMTQALGILGPDAQRLYPLFITVDPERDTPERLRLYAPAFDPRIRYLTGSPTAVAEVLESWKATRAKIAAKNSETGGDYSMSHSSIVYLMSPDDRLLEAYRWELSPAQLAEKIRARIKP